MCIRDSFLTASLHVDYLKPTPIDLPLELRARVKEIKGRKVIINVDLIAHGEICARGEIVTVQVPDEFMARIMGQSSEQ